MFARLWILCLLARSSGLACNSRLGKSQVNKLSRTSGSSSGQPDDSMTNEPCARRRIQFFWTQIGEKASVCSAELEIQELSAWTTGIGFEGRGKHGILNCGDGDIAACPSLDQGSPESKSLFYTYLREIIPGCDACPGIGDNGNGRRLAVTKDRGTNALDHSDVMHCASLRDCQQDVGRTHVDKGMAYSFRSRSPLLAQRRGAEFLGGVMSFIPKGRGPYPGRTASDPGSANSTSTTDYVSPAQLHSLSYPRKRRSFPACSPLESSHPFARLQPTAAYLYLPTMIPCHRALVLGSVAPPSKFYRIKGCTPVKA